MDPKHRRLMLAVGVLALVILNISMKNARAQQPRVFDASQNLLRRVQPQYTGAARKAHYEGRVEVNFVLGRDGMAHDIKIVNSPGYGMDRNIVEALKQWRWDSVFIAKDQEATTAIVFKLPK